MHLALESGPYLPIQRNDLMYILNFQDMHFGLVFDTLQCDFGSKQFFSDAFQDMHLEDSGYASLPVP